MSGLQVLVCIFLWLVVDVIKTMMAKLMANHFHQETYFQRMQEALRKVRAHCLSVTLSCHVPKYQACKAAAFCSSVAVAADVNNFLAAVMRHNCMVHMEWHLERQAKHQCNMLGRAVGITQHFKNPIQECEASKAMESQRVMLDVLCCRSTS